VCGGVLAARTGFMLDTARNYCRLLGTTLGPFEARLISRGIKTLSLRLNHQCASALRVAEWMERHPAVVRVIYPGLASHPQHKLAALLMCDTFGALVTLELDPALLGPSPRAGIFGFMDALKLILPATSLGDVYTLITYPPVSSHRDVAAEDLRAQGISEGMLRLSIGIEDVEDIIGDLSQAMDTLRHMRAGA
jgi:cystathionine gamma-synthase/methionine-gamma-lyase